MDGQWRKSSHSNSFSNCVEVRWQKATTSMSGGHRAQASPGACGGMIHVRDSKNPGGPVLSVSPGTWAAFLGGVRRGEFG